MSTFAVQHYRNHLAILFAPLQRDQKSRQRFWSVIVEFSEVLAGEGRSQEPELPNSRPVQLIRLFLPPRYTQLAASEVERMRQRNLIAVTTVLNPFIALLDPDTRTYFSDNISLRNAAVCEVELMRCSEDPSAWVVRVRDYYTDTDAFIDVRQPIS